MISCFKAPYLQEPPLLINYIGAVITSRKDNPMFYPLESH